MIPKRIITIWLSESEQKPELIQRCFTTHSIPGYEHVIITLENCFKGTTYVRECLEAKKWAKAADYLRIHYLNELGGIYLDADVEVLPGRDFDSFLGDALFCGKEKNNFISNAIIGAEAGHPILSDYLRTVETNFIGSGELVYQPGMYLWTEKAGYNPLGQVIVYEPSLFLPFDWQTNVMEKTDNTRCIHWFNKSWL